MIVARGEYNLPVLRHRHMSLGREYHMVVDDFASQILPTESSFTCEKVGCSRGCP